MHRWFDFLSKNGWHTNVNDGIISLFITLSGISAQDYVDTRYFNVFATVDVNKFLTSYGQKHYDDVLAITHDLLNRDYQISNTNYIFKMYNFENGKIIFDEYDGTLHLEVYSTARNLYDFDGIYEIPASVPAYSTDIRDSYAESITREAESILRNESGVQHKWISERVLFRQVESAFTTLRVQQHARPSFLGRQHYDVYIPELKVALEYQGEQHFIPIPFFGGKAGLIATQERDRRKKGLSECNNIHQIDVLPGYDIASILKDILKHDHTNKYEFDTLLSNARSLHKGDIETQESRESVVSRINDNHESNINNDDTLTELIDELVQKASKTKIGQRKLTTKAILRYQGLAAKYMRINACEEELRVRIMMYARGIKDYSFDQYWREKELIKKIGIENMKYKESIWIS